MQKMGEETGVSQDAIKNLIMPFNTGSGAMQFGNKFGGNQDMGFYNKNVFKPIRGGGAANAF